MRTVKRNSLPVVFALISVISLSSTALAQETQKNHASTTAVTIKNFGQMDERFFRGAQPKETEYKELAALGVNTIVDLRDDAKGYAKETAESLGMRYVNIPMSDKDYPPAEKIAEFLKLVDDPSTGKFYVHCAGGRHRTGVMGAVYRFNHYGWDFEKVYAEMKKYDFYTRWGHGEMKKFVQDYAVGYQPKATTTVDTKQ